MGIRLFDSMKRRTLSLIIWFFVIVCCFLYLFLFKSSVYTPEISNHGFGSEIIQGDTYSFDFTCDRDGLRSVGVSLATYLRDNHSALYVNMYDSSGVQVEEWYISNLIVKDAAYQEFYLTDSISNSKNQTYTITISSDAIPGQGICFGINNQSSGLKYNGEELGIGICYQLGYETSLINTFLTNSSSVRLAGMVVLILFFISIGVAVRLLVRDFSLYTLILVVLPNILLLFFTDRIINHCSMVNLSHKAVLLLAYVAISSIWIITISIAYYYLLEKNASMHKVALVVLSILSVVSIFFNTPTAVSDGVYHYESAYHYSNCFMGYATPFEDEIDEEGNPVLFLRDADAELLYNTNSTWFLSEDSYCKTIGLLSPNETSLEVHPYKRSDFLNNLSLKSSVVPLAPIIPALGITLGRILNLNALLTFYLGRLFNCIFFVLIAYLSIKIIPIGKDILFIIFTLPTTLAQCSSMSYDCFVISICILFTSLLIRILYQDEAMTRKQFVFLTILAILVVFCKYAYAPLILCVFTIPASKIPLKHPVAFKRIIFGMILLGLVLVLSIPVFRSIVDASLTPLLYRVGKGSWARLLSGFIEIGIMTTFVHAQDILESMICRPGWGQLFMSSYVYLVYFFIIAVVSVSSNIEKTYLKKWDKFLFIISIVCTIVLISTPMIMSKSPNGGDAIFGINGRYFTCLLPLLCITLRPKINISEKAYLKADILSVYMSFFCWIYTLMEVFGVFQDVVY